MSSPAQEEILRAKLNQETAAIPWTDLLRFFASGTVIQVADDLDLVEVATIMSNDDTATVARWIEQSRIARVSDEQAQSWVESDAEVWTVVVKPWILVQERRTS